MCQTIILCDNKETIVSQCVDCRGAFIWHNNLMLTFSLDEFRQSNDIIHSLAFEGTVIRFLTEKIGWFGVHRTLVSPYASPVRNSDVFCTDGGGCPPALYAMIRHN